MRYVVELTNRTARKIADWNLSSHLYDEILNQFDLLGTSPIRFLVRVPAPDEALELEFCARDPGDPAKAYLFIFSVVYHADEETLIVRDGDYLCIDVEPSP